jgi:hypothetical protein
VRACDQNSHRIHGKMRSTAHELNCGLHSLNVLRQRGTPHLDLHGGVALIQALAQLIFQLRQTFARGIPAATDIARDLAGKLPLIEALRQQDVQGQILDLGDGIPQRHVKGAHSNGTLCVPARLLALHHASQ